MAMAFALSLLSFRCGVVAQWWVALNGVKVMQSCPSQDRLSLFSGPHLIRHDGGAKPLKMPVRLVFVILTTYDALSHGSEFKARGVALMIIPSFRRPRCYQWKKDR